MTKKSIAIGVLVLFFLAALVFYYLNRPSGAKPLNGGYLYENQDLGFSLVLPKEFEYWQVQRKNSGSFIDIEFFVPSSDPTVKHEVPGYAKPAVVRIYSDAKAALDKDFEKLSEGNGRLYAIAFWQSPPGDWAERWKNELKDDIIKSFKIE